MSFLLLSVCGWSGSGSGSISRVVKLWRAAWCGCECCVVGLNHLMNEWTPWG